MSKKHNLIIFALFVALVNLSSCRVQNQISSQDNCNTQSPVIKTLYNAEGLFLIDNATKHATITIHTAGTIDDVAIYHICNLPAELPLSNSKVNVSGKVRASKQVSSLGGYKNYELEVESLKALSIN